MGNKTELELLEEKKELKIKCMAITIICYALSVLLIITVGKLRELKKDNEPEEKVKVESEVKPKIECAVTEYKPYELKLYKNVPSYAKWLNYTKLTVVEIHGHEYIIGTSCPSGHSSFGFMTHKADCKYCEKNRWDKILKK